MKIKLFTTVIACFILTGAFSQISLNDYKYIIVPKKFDFLKEENQYRLNSLTKFLFEKQGFMVVVEGTQYPDDLASNICMGLKSDVEKAKGLFKTKLAVVLKNCQGGVVYTTQTGESRIKEYDKAYNEALRKAFKSFETINYSYSPNQNNVISLEKAEKSVKNEVSQEIQKLKKEIQSLKKEQVIENKPKLKQIKKPLPKDAQAKAVTEVKQTQTISNVLYAQETAYGYQLVDSSPKVVYRIKKTNLKNVFLVENKSALIYKKENIWVLEYYLNNSLQQETINIKF